MDAARPRQSPEIQRPSCRGRGLVLAHVMAGQSCLQECLQIPPEAFTRGLQSHLYAALGLRDMRVRAGRLLVMDDSTDFNRLGSRLGSALTWTRRNASRIHVPTQPVDGAAAHHHRHHHQVHSLCPTYIAGCEHDCSQTRQVPTHISQTLQTHLIGIFRIFTPTLLALSYFDPHAAYRISTPTLLPTRSGLCVASLPIMCLQHQPHRHYPMVSN